MKPLARSEHSLKDMALVITLDSHQLLFAVQFDVFEGCWMRLHIEDTFWCQLLV